MISITVCNMDGYKKVLTLEFLKVDQTLADMNFDQFKHNTEGTIISAQYFSYNTILLGHIHVFRLLIVNKEKWLRNDKYA